MLPFRVSVSHAIARPAIAKVQLSPLAGAENFSSLALDLFVLALSQRPAVELLRSTGQGVPSMTRARNQRIVRTLHVQRVLAFTREGEGFRGEALALLVVDLPGKGTDLGLFSPLPGHVSISR